MPATAILLHAVNYLSRDERANLFAGITVPDEKSVERTHVAVAEIETDDADDLSICERLYELTNSPAPSDNGVLVEKVARAARTLATHTSTSVGDCVRIERVTTSGGKYHVTGKSVATYACSNVGFVRIN